MVRVWLTLQTDIVYKNCILESYAEALYLEECVSYSSPVLPDNKVHGANMGPSSVLSSADGPHVGPMNLTIWGVLDYFPAWCSTLHYGQVFIATRCTINVPCAILIQLAGVKVDRWQVGIRWWWWIVMFVCAACDTRDTLSARRSWVVVFCVKSTTTLSATVMWSPLIKNMFFRFRLLIHCDIQLMKYDSSYMFCRCCWCCFRNDNTSINGQPLIAKWFLVREDSVMAL